MFLDTVCCIMYVCILLQSVPVLRAPTAAFAMVLIRRNGGNDWGSRCSGGLVS